MLGGLHLDALKNKNKVHHAEETKEVFCCDDEAHIKTYFD